MGNVVLFIDDVRDPNQYCSHKDIVDVARSSKDAIQFLLYNRCVGYDTIYLDFDLGGDDTAMPVVMWLAEEAFYGHLYSVDYIYLISDNPVGREACRLILERWKYHISDSPAGTQIYLGRNRA